MSSFGNPNMSDTQRSSQPEQLSATAAADAAKRPSLAGDLHTNPNAHAAELAGDKMKSTQVGEIQQSSLVSTFPADQPQPGTSAKALQKPGETLPTQRDAPEEAFPTEVGTVNKGVGAPTQPTAPGHGDTHTLPMLYGGKGESGGSSGFMGEKSKPIGSGIGGGIGGDVAQDAKQLVNDAAQGAKEKLQDFAPATGQSTNTTTTSSTSKLQGQLPGTLAASGSYGYSAPTGNTASGSLTDTIGQNINQASQRVADAARTVASSGPPLTEGVQPLPAIPFSHLSEVVTASVGVLASGLGNFGARLNEIPLVQDFTHNAQDFGANVAMHSRETVAELGDRLNNMAQPAMQRVTATVAPLAQKVGLPLPAGMTTTTTTTTREVSRAQAHRAVPLYRTQEDIARDTARPGAAIADTVSSTVTTVKERVSHLASDTATLATDTAATVKERVSHLASDTATLATDTAATVKEKVQQLTASVTQTAVAAKDTVTHAAQDAAAAVTALPAKATAAVSQVTGTGTGEVAPSASSSKIISTSTASSSTNTGMGGVGSMLPGSDTLEASRSSAGGISKASDLHKPATATGEGAKLADTEAVRLAKKQPEGFDATVPQGAQPKPATAVGKQAAAKQTSGGKASELSKPGASVLTSSQSATAGSGSLPGAEGLLRSGRDTTIGYGQGVKPAEATATSLPYSSGSGSGMSSGAGLPFGMGSTGASIGSTAGAGTSHVQDMLDSLAPKGGKQAGSKQQ